MSELIECQHCGRRVVSEAIKRIGKLCVCPRCVEIATRAVDAEELTAKQQKAQFALAQGEGRRCGMERSPPPTPTQEPVGNQHGTLKPCPDCHKEISAKAPTCPHCGCPKPFGGTLLSNTAMTAIKKVDWVWVAVVVAVGVVVWFLGGGLIGTVVAVVVWGVAVLIAKLAKQTKREK